MMRRLLILFMVAAVAGCATGPNPNDFGVGPPAAAPVFVDPAEAAAIVTALRAEHDLPPVTVSAALNAIARDYADLLALRGTVGHNVDGSLRTRLSQGDYLYVVAGENLGGGYRSIEEAFDRWIASPEHLRNLLAEPITEIGIATAFNINSLYRTYWVLLVARPES
jgi:uncharacterized protein YkwD